MSQKAAPSSFTHNSDHSLESNKLGWDANAFSNESDDSQDIQKDIQNIKMEFSDNDSNPSGGQPFSLSSLPPLVSPENDSKVNLKLQNSSSSRGFMSIFSSTDASHGNDNAVHSQQSQPKVDTFSATNKATAAVSITNHNDKSGESLLVAANVIKQELSTAVIGPVASNESASPHKHSHHRSKDKKKKSHKEDKHSRKEHKKHKNKDKERDREHKEKKRRDKEESSDLSKIKVEQPEVGSLKLKISRSRASPPETSDMNDINNPSSLKLKIGKERLSGAPTDLRNHKRKLSADDSNSRSKKSFGLSESLFKNSQDD
jgi:hypothetical protein